MLENEIKLAEGNTLRARKRQSNIFVAGSPLKRQSFLTFSLALDVFAGEEAQYLLDRTPPSHNFKRFTIIRTGGRRSSCGTRL